MLVVHYIPRFFWLQSFARIRKWLEHARSAPSLKVLAGGNCDDRKGYFVEPTIVQTTDPQDSIMNEVHLNITQDVTPECDTPERVTPEHVPPECITPKHDTTEDDQQLQYSDLSSYLHTFLSVQKHN